MAEWGAESVPGAPRPDAITLIEGTAFCVCSASGNIYPGGTDGIFFRDTRLISAWELLVDGEQIEPVGVLSAEPYCARFLGLGHPRPGRRDGTLLVERTRYVGDGMREDVAIHNYSDEPAALQIELRVESDLAGIFDVKAHRIRDWGDRTTEAAGDSLIISSRLYQRMRGVRISGETATPSPGGFSFVAVVAPRDVWRTTVQVLPIIDGQELPPRFPPRQPMDETGPARRHHAWEQASPSVSTPHQGLGRALRQSRADLGSLRIFDTDRPDLPPAVAAGAPWFMTIFGRDSLIASWMSLPLDQSLALGTVRVLADLQGERTDPLTEEEPGKIIHELRHGTDAIAALDGAGPGGAAYFGSVDATPLFVMLLGELWRWGLPGEVLQELLPHADRALQWIEKFGDLDGDGFVEYKRKTDRGLFNQGWKDSFDGINFADGALAQPPVALAEVQAYVYAAYLAGPASPGAPGMPGSPSGTPSGPQP